MEMKVTQLISAPLFYGTWLLRYTNDHMVDHTTTNYLQIEDNATVKFKSLSYGGLVGIKKSRTALVHRLEEKNDTLSSFLVGFRYLKRNVYTYSFLGIEIPEIQTESREYYQERNLTVRLDNRVLLIHDHDASLFYVFDLCLGKIRYPNIETSLKTFLFTQLFGIVIGYLLNKV